MRRILTLLTLGGAVTLTAFAADFNGNLLDANCWESQQKSKQQTAQSCDATSKTTTFAIESAGKTYKLDAAGNEKAMTALKNRADRSKPGAQPSAHIMAKVSGADHNGTISVDSVEVQ